MGGKENMRTYAEIIAEFKNIAENPRKAMDAFKVDKDTIAELLKINQ